jgi:hypothetical protein
LVNFKIKIKATQYFTFLSKRKKIIYVVLTTYIEKYQRHGRTKVNPILNPIKLISMPFPLLVNVIVILVVSSQIEYGRAGGKIRNENIINVSKLNVLLKN